MLQTVHGRMRRAVDAYLDGELPPARAVVVHVHLDECWGCSGYADTVRLMQRSLRRLGQRRPSDLAVARLRRWAQAHMS
ncbi:MAG: zf-HC2 domain-containing protein [Acidimicrobiales bacterium]